jgi:hypothetical protein
MKGRELSDKILQLCVIFRLKMRSAHISISARSLVFNVEDSEEEYIFRRVIFDKDGIVIQDKLDKCLTDVKRIIGRIDILCNVHWVPNFIVDAILGICTIESGEGKTSVVRYASGHVMNVLITRSRVYFAGVGMEDYQKVMNAHYDFLIENRMPCSYQRHGDINDID